MITEQTMLQMEHGIKAALSPEDKVTYLLIAGDISGTYILANCGNKVRMQDLLEDALHKVSLGRELHMERPQ